MFELARVRVIVGIFKGSPGRYRGHVTRAIELFNKVAATLFVSYKAAMERTPEIFVEKGIEIDKESEQNSRGRPQLYAGGFQSVRGTLEKSLRLDFDVFNRWNYLKKHSKWKTHSQFARHLLELFELEQSTSTGNEINISRHSPDIWSSKRKLVYVD